MNFAFGVCIFVSLVFSPSFVSGRDCNLEFARAFYTGTYANGNVTFYDNSTVLEVALVVGYDSTINYTLSGAYSQSFAVVRSTNRAFVFLTTPLPDTIPYVMLTLAASYSSGSSDVTRTAIRIKIESYSGVEVGDCQIAGVTNEQWSNGLILNILDTDRGLTFQRSLSNVTSLSFESVAPSLNNAPYIDASIVNRELSLTLSDKYRFYEVYETSQRMAYALKFACSDGKTKVLTVTYNIRDTNNYQPAFVPTSTFNYSITLPMPAGFPVSFVRDIVVRDNDLTTYEIAAQIENNDYFDLLYGGVDGTGKNFKLVLTAKRAIANLTGPLSLFILASDRDLTGFPSFSTFAQLNIEKDDSFSCDSELIV